jgi:UDP-2-acetamido-2-deoxy-ribo-hexuluronate aminotransferase
MGIAFMDLRSQYKGLGDSVIRRIEAILEHGMYCNGPEIVELERELAALTGCTHVLGVSSGTDALIVPLMAYGVGPGDAIFTSPFTFFATAEAIALVGATPVFVDILPDTYNIDPGKLAEAVARVKAEGKLRARGVIPVDIFGLPADYDPIEALAAKEDLFVLEDAAQSLGGKYKGRPVGALGHVAATSFYPSKPLGCYGDGGAVFTSDSALNAIMTSIRVHGQGSDKYNNVRLGLNARLDSFQGAVLLAKMPTFAEELVARDRVAKVYGARLRGVGLPVVPDGLDCAWALYTVRHPRRDALATHLKERGVPSGIYYGRCLHEQDAFTGLGYRTGDLPISEQAAREVLSLPMHPFLTDGELDTIVEAVNSFA